MAVSIIFLSRYEGISRWMEGPWKIRNSPYSQQFLAAYSISVASYCLISLCTLLPDLLWMVNK